MMTKTKISTIILTRNESPEDLTNCITHIQPYVDEIIIIDSSDNTSAEIVANKLITNNVKCKYLITKIEQNNINGFDDLRNFGQAVASNNWCLHIDVDETIPEELFSNINSIIKDKENPSNAYAFPRINLPFYELYPDYQVRLINKMKTEWVNKIHEKVEIFTSPSEVIYLNEYPIIHKQKTQNKKLEINKRWSTIQKSRNILICSLFKESEKYINNFLDNLINLITYSTTSETHRIDLNFIEGNSTDKTHIILADWLNKHFPENPRKRYKVSKINLPSNIDRFHKLAILRNMLIKFGLKSYHDYVLMIDSDTLFHKDLLCKLINSMESNHCDAIAPLPLIEDFRDYKNDYFYDTLAFIDNNNNNFRHFYPYCNEMSKKDLIKMNSIGTCYLIKSSIYNINDFGNYNITKCHEESINKQIISYEGYDENNKLISEQVSFFNKVKKKGFQIYVDNNIEIFHINLEKLGLKWH